MGGNHSNQFDEKLFHTQWKRKQVTSLGARTIWVSKSQPNRQIEEYPVYADTEDEIDIQRELFNLRKDSAQLVAATHLKQTVKGGLCSNSAQGRLFLQRILLKLQALQHIPFPDILHLHFNALTGYKRLNKAVGPFRPGSEQIGFNDAGEAKVWMNNDFSASAPTSKEISEVAMVRNLLQIIEDSTDMGTTPRQNPSIMNFIYRNNNDVAFDQALKQIKDFANLYNNGIIPKNLECLKRVGIQNISKSLASSPQVSSSHLQTQGSNKQIVGAVQQQGLAGQQQQFVNQQPLIAQQSVVNQQQLVSQQPLITQQPIVQQYRPFQLQQKGIPSVPAYQEPPFAKNYIPIPQPFLPPPITQQTQPIKVVQPPQAVKVVQQQPLPVKTFQQSQPLYVQQPQPVRIVQQQPYPIQFAQQPLQKVLPTQPVQVLNTSAIKVQNIDAINVNAQPQNQVQQRSIQSQVPTVRPMQPVFVKPSEELKVIQQVIRTPQGSIPIVPQLPVGETVANSLNQQPSFRISQQQPVQNQVPIQKEMYTEVISGRQDVPFIQDLNVKEQLPQENKFSVLAKQSQVQILNQLQKQTSRSQVQEQSYPQNLPSTQNEAELLPKVKNFTDFNSMNFAIDTKSIQQYPSQNSSPQKQEAQKITNLASSKFSDISLEDGKSSQALLAQLRGFSTMKKQDIPTYNAYDFSTNYYTSSLRNEDFTTNYNTTKGQTDQSQELYGTFNKYAQRGKWDENIEMKYSMTKNLYDQPAETNAEQGEVDAHEEDEPVQRQFLYHEDIEKFQHEGEYHVDFDPEILADIEKLKN